MQRLTTLLNELIRSPWWLEIATRPSIVNKLTGEKGWWITLKSGRRVFVVVRNAIRWIRRFYKPPIGKNIPYRKDLPPFPGRTQLADEWGQIVLGEWMATSSGIRKILREGPLKYTSDLFDKNVIPLPKDNINLLRQAYPALQTAEFFRTLPLKYTPNGDLSKPLYRGMVWTLDRKNFAKYLSMKEGSVTYLDNTYASYSFSPRLAKQFMLASPFPRYQVLIKVQKRIHPGYNLWSSEDEVLWPAQPVRVIKKIYSKGEKESLISSRKYSFERLVLIVEEVPLEKKRGSLGELIRGGGILTWTEVFLRPPIVNKLTGRKGWWVTLKTGRRVFLELRKAAKRLRRIYKPPIGKNVPIKKDLPLFPGGSFEEFKNLPGFTILDNWGWWSAQYKEILSVGPIKYIESLFDQGVYPEKKTIANVLKRAEESGVLGTAEFFRTLPLKYAPNGDLSRRIYRGMAWGPDGYEHFKRFANVRKGARIYLDRTYASYTYDFRIARGFAEQMLEYPRYQVIIYVAKRYHPGYALPTVEKEVIWPAQLVYIEDKRRLVFEDAKGRTVERIELLVTEVRPEWRRSVVSGELLRWFPKSFESKAFKTFLKLLNRKTKWVNGREGWWLRNKATGRPFFLEKRKLLDSPKKVGPITLSVGGFDFENEIITALRDKRIQALFVKKYGSKFPSIEKLVKELTPLPGVPINVYLSPAAGSIIVEDRVTYPSNYLFRVSIGIGERHLDLNLWLAPFLQGKGIGKSWLRKALHIADITDVTMLRTQVTGPGSYVFARMGFKPTGGWDKHVENFVAFLRQYKGIDRKAIPTLREARKTFKTPLDIADFYIGKVHVGKKYWTRSVGIWSESWIINLNDPLQRMRLEEYIDYATPFRRHTKRSVFVRSFRTKIFQWWSAVLKYEYTVNPETGELGWFFRNHETGNVFFVSTVDLLSKMKESLSFPVGKDLVYKKGTSYTKFDLTRLSNLEYNILYKWYQDNSTIRGLLRGEEKAYKLTRSFKGMVDPFWGVPGASVIEFFRTLPYRYTPNGDLRKPLYRGLSYDLNTPHRVDLLKLKSGDIFYLEDTYASFAYNIEDAKWFADRRTKGRLASSRNIVIKVQRRKHPGWHLYSSIIDEIIWPAQPLRVIETFDGSFYLIVVEEV